MDRLRKIMENSADFSAQVRGLERGLDDDRVKKEDRGG